MELQSGLKTLEFLKMELFTFFSIQQKLLFTQTCVSLPFAINSKLSLNSSKLN